MQGAVGQTITLGNFGTILTSIYTGGTPLPTSVLCTDCVKAGYNVLVKDVPSIGSNATVTGALTSACGASFVGQFHPKVLIIAV